MARSLERPAAGPRGEAAGLRAYLVFGLGAALFCYGFFHRIAPSVMIDSLMRDFAVGGAILGNLSAFYFYAYAGLQVPVGLFVDRWGARRMLTLGASLCALGSLAFSLADSLTLAYLGRLLIGAGAGFSFVGTLALATAWFPPDRFAQMTGLTMMAGLLGGVLGQAPLAALVEATGWRTTLLLASALGGLLALAIWLFVRDRRPDAEAPRVAAGARALLSGLGQVIGMRQIWLIALIGAAMSAPMLSFAGLWGVAWLMQVYGMTRPQAAATTSLLLLGWAAGAPLTGVLSDRLRRRVLPVQLGGLLGLAALLLIVYLPLASAFLYVLFFLAGLGLGAMSVCYAITREAAPPSAIGAAYGLVNGLVVATGAVFQPLIGFLLDTRWQGAIDAGARVYSPGSYRFAFAVLILFLLVGLAASLRILETGGAKTEAIR